MHPIHYSLIFNFVALFVCGALAWKFGQPMLVIICLMLAQHTMGRFHDGDEDDDDEGTPKMGFTAKI